MKDQPFEARKVIRAAYSAAQDSAAEVLDEPLVVARAEGTCVVPLEKQQNRRG